MPHNVAVVKTAIVAVVNSASNTNTKSDLPYFIRRLFDLLVLVSGVAVVNFYGK